MASRPDDWLPFDIDYPRALLVGLVVVIAVAVVLGASTSTAAFGAFNPDWEGASDLRGTADAVGTDDDVLLNASRYDRVQSEGTVVMVLSPDRAYSQRDRERVREFVQEGGTLVVAEDFGEHSNALLAAVGAEARFDGALVRDERSNYRSPAMPVTRNLSSNPLVAGADQLTLNHGTVLEPGNATVVASTSEFAYRDVNRNDALDDEESLRSYPIVTTEQVGEGRVIAVSDPSVFINAMQDRTGNRQLTRNVLRRHERLVLDYSHSEQVPPLAAALIVLRQSPLLQALGGLLGLLAITAWGRGVPATLAERLGRGRTTESGPVGQDAEELSAFLKRRHPDWDDERIRRVAKGVSPWQDRDRNDERP